MKKTENVKADPKGIERISQLVSEYSEKCGVSEKDINNAVLAAEECANGLAEHAPEGEEIKVIIKTFPGFIKVVLSSKGDSFNPTADINVKHMLDDDMDYLTQEALRGIILTSLADKLKYRHLNGVNRISFIVHRSLKTHLYMTLGAMALAIVVGLLLSELQFKEFNDILNNYLLVPIYTVYLNALKMIVAPVVFFSIVSCIVQFTDLSELGRIGGRVITVFLFTTVIAVFVGISVFILFKPGSPITSMIDVQETQKITSQTINVSIKDMLVGIVPSDFLQPFLDSQMLSIIFLAVFIGIATGRIGQNSNMVRHAFEACNELFLEMTTMIIRFMPIAVFCSICSMMIKVGVPALLSILGSFGTFLVGLLCMMIVYCLILTVIGKMNPLYFIRKYVPTMTQVFSLASSNAAIPVNMEACEKMGVSKKVYCLSIPLGATLNMDGTCVYMAVFALALANSYGVHVPMSAMTAMVISIIVLSIGAPGIPGSGLICLSVLLTQLKVPTEAIGLVMGIDGLVGMFRCMSNCTGDVMTSILVAKKENMLDQEKYRSKA